MTNGLNDILAHREDQFGPRVVDHFQRIFPRIPRAAGTLDSSIEAGHSAGHDDLMHFRRLL